MAAKKATKKKTSKTPEVKVKVKRVKKTETVKTTTKVAAPKKTAKKTKMKVYSEKQTRIEIVKELADKTGLNKTSIESVFTNLVEIINGHMGKKGSGEITIPMTGIKIKRIQKARTKARTMTSPLINEEVVIPAKPARAAVKLIALKTLKETVA